ncbi:MAG: FecR domain-containing protein [Bauldia sp.]
MSVRFSGLVCLALLVASPSPTFAAAIIGTVSKVQGFVVGVSEGSSRNLATKAPIHQDEVVTTGNDARLEITFEDGTKLTVGEKAKLTIDSFVYRPKAGGNQFAINVTGAFRYTSGQLGKSPDASVTVTTPTAVLGARGTSFWGGPIDGISGVLLFEGQVTVSTPAGLALLNRPGTGVDLRPGAAPSAVSAWPQAKVNRAVATVTFR